MHIVVMGVSGCGKSEVGQRIADTLHLPLIEGDAFHPPANIEKMKSGVPLTDADRAGWLDTLAGELAARPQGAVLTCSALKRAYRDRLRAAVPALRFVHLALPEAEAQRRVASRPGHFYPPALVASQFAALEDPAGEPGVVTVDATVPLEEVVGRALAGLAALEGMTGEFNNP
jgi:gluconokinase